MITSIYTGCMLTLAIVAEPNGPEVMLADGALVVGMHNALQQVLVNNFDLQTAAGINGLIGYGQVMSSDLSLSEFERQIGEQSVFCGSLVLQLHENGVR